MPGSEMLILIFSQPSIFSCISLDFEYEGTHLKKAALSYLCIKTSANEF